MLSILSVLKDPDSNPYSLLEGEGDLGGDTDASESMGGSDRRRRSRRRRNDQEPSVIDAANESDGQAATSENGLGKMDTNVVWSALITVVTVVALDQLAVETITRALIFQKTKANPRGATEAAVGVTVLLDPRGALPAVTDSQVRELL